LKGGRAVNNRWISNEKEKECGKDETDVFFFFLLSEKEKKKERKKKRNKKNKTS